MLSRTLVSLCAATMAAVPACGGGAPLLHPAHTLPAEQLSVATGMSSNFVLGDAKSRVESARGATEEGIATGDDNREKLAYGALAHAALTPGLAPFVAARVGLGYDSEAGLSYTGRTARLDARYAVINDTLALSIGLGASGVLSRQGSSGPGGVRDSEISGVDLGSTTGFGLDIPVLVGYRSTGSIATAYGGVRVGYERVFGEFRFRDPSPDLVPVSAFGASRFYGGGLLGLGIGLRPIWVIVELAVNASYAKGSISPDRVERVGQIPITNPGGPTLSDSWLGVSVAPAAALRTKF